MKTFKTTLKTSRVKCLAEARAYCKSLRMVYGIVVCEVRFVTHWLFKTVTVCVTYRVA
jgi:hypothetical protein